MTDEQAYDMGYEHGWNRMRPDSPQFGFIPYVNGYAQGSRERDEEEEDEARILDDEPELGFVEPSLQEKREALRKSCEHWDENVARHKEDKQFDFTSQACACCHLAAESSGVEVDSDAFFFGNWSCSGCPIYDYTGMQNCEGTPYRGAIGPDQMAKWLRQLLNGEKPEIET